MSNTGELTSKLARDGLPKDDELYRYIVDLSGLLPWTADGDGEILAVGNQWVQWTGAPVAAALGQGWLSFVHPEDRRSVHADWLHAVRTSDRLSIRWRLRFADGCYRWIEGRTRKRMDGASLPALWYGTLEDVHERQIVEEANQRMQAELIHASRLNAVGAMASVIAHDLNQPLTAAAHFLRGSRQLLRKAGALSAEVADALEEADRNIVRSSEIVRRMRGFIASGEMERTVEPLTEIVQEACDFALADATRRGIGHRAEFETGCKVLVDRVQVQQVLVNLLRNAVEAVSKVDCRDIVLRTRSLGSDLCEVTVEDSGPGIPPANRERLFDPFFSTRRDGMGLGLAISRMIVEAHGGTIWTEPREGGGTLVGFTVPKAIVPPDPQEPEVAV
jgi:two-component system, LuxR family, sensor kinase FixL